MQNDITSIDTSNKPYEHWKLTGTLFWGLMIGSIFLISQTVAVIMTLLIRDSNLTAASLMDVLKSSPHNGTLLSVGTITSMIIGCAVMVGAIKIKKRSNLIDYLAIKPVPFRVIATWLGFILAFALVSDVLSFSLGRPFVTSFMETAYRTAHPVWLLWVALIIAAPIFEEMFFRGFIYKGLATSPIGSFGCILLTAVLWSVIHIQYDAFNVGVIFFMGLLLGVARWRTGSLYVPIAMHATANLLATLETAIMN
jgi:uncharacterized protein